MQYLLMLGFRGRTRPNLLLQETTSIICAIRILYHLLSDRNRLSDYDVIERRLLGVINGGLEYFLLLSSEIHREAWTQVLLLILTRMLQLHPDQVKCVWIDAWRLFPWHIGLQPGAAVMHICHNLTKHLVAAAFTPPS